MIVDTFVLDYGGVVADHYCEPYMSRLSSLLGVTPSKARELVSERSPHGRQYRLDKLSKRQFWSAVSLLAENKSFDEDIAQDLWARTYMPNTAILSLLSHLKNNLKLKTGIVMNEDRWRYEYVINSFQWGDYVDLIVASYEVGFVKPELNMYIEVLKKHDRHNQPNRLLYVDDRQTHVDAAISCGMNGYVYVNAGDLSRYLEGVQLIPFEYNDAS